MTTTTAHNQLPAVTSSSSAAAGQTEQANMNTPLGISQSDWSVKRASITGPAFIHVRHDEALGLDIFEWTNPTTGAVSVVAFSGRRMKADVHYRFSTQARADQYKAKFVAQLQEAHNYKAEKKAQRVQLMAQPHSFAVGDVLASKWGYEQTNVNYYQVTAISGTRTVEIRPIKAESLDGPNMTGLCVPVKDAFKGPAILKRVGNSGDFVKMNSYEYAFKKELQQVGGVSFYKPDHWTAYH